MSSRCEPRAFGCSRSRRLMFSMPMIASSTSTPRATAKPPKVIVFSDSPIRCSTATAASRDSGDIALRSWGLEQDALCGGVHEPRSPKWERCAAGVSQFAEGESEACELAQVGQDLDLAYRPAEDDDVCDSRHTEQTGLDDP